MNSFYIDFTGHYISDTTVEVPSILAHIGMESILYLRSTSAVPDVNNTHSDATKLQMLKSIKTKFYIHKSFDIQSDMEFLPAIPSEMSNERNFKKANNAYAFNPHPSPIPTSNIMYDTRHSNEYYSNSMNGGTPGLHYNHITGTPKTRMAYLSQSSPKRTSPTSPAAGGMKNLRKKTSSNAKPFIPSSGLHSASPNQYADYSEYYYNN